MPDDNPDSAVEVTTAATLAVIYGLGAGIAGTLSWLRYHSMYWVIFHGLISWLYVFYRFFKG